MAQRRFMAGTLESRKIFSQLHSIVLQCTIDLDVAPSGVAHPEPRPDADSSRSSNVRAIAGELVRRGIGSNDEGLPHQRIALSRVISIMPLGALRPHGVDDSGCRGLRCIAAPGPDRSNPRLDA
jgi:hypothetical protein